MKRNMDDLVREDMNKEQELPTSIRFAFDQSYEQIRQRPKKKAKKSWLKPVSAAVAVLALSSAVLLTNDTALAKLQAFLGINDSGLETAMENGDLHSIAQTQTSENMTITLDNFFADAFRLGLQFTIDSKHIVEDDLNGMTIEYRLFDATGQEIDAAVSDTKEIAGPGLFDSAELQLTNVNNNSATLSYIAGATTATVPSLEGAQLIVEAVHLVNNDGSITSVDGKWAFDLTTTNVVQQVYTAANTVPGLTLQQAIVTNGSMQVSYTIDGLNEDNSHPLFETAIVNSKGEAYYVKNAHVERLEKEQQTVINLVFPYSVWNEQQSLSLKVKGYEELKLVKKE
ncbi:DUF4179 domain-containing protein [Bacillus sp. Bva_UNVM-123]|uniref:DUF4179 domain-containing protein n=1 Tax=Bacillus sp. Bva_UNVM-123 TaxID=2829798 RepID=UPI00391EF6DC